MATLTELAGTCFYQYSPMLSQITISQFTSLTRFTVHSTLRGLGYWNLHRPSWDNPFYEPEVLTILVFFSRPVWRQRCHGRHGSRGCHSQRHVGAGRHQPVRCSYANGRRQGQAQQHRQGLGQQESTFRRLQVSPWGHCARFSVCLNFPNTWPSHRLTFWNATDQ